MVVFIIVVSCWVLSINRSPLARIPGPTPLPLFGNVLMLLGPSEKNLPVMKSLNQKFGNVVLFYFGAKPMVLLFSAQGAERLLSSSKDISKGFQYKYVWPWLGQGLLTSTGAKWNKHRKLLTPTFHFRILEDFLQVMVDHTDVLLQKLEKEAERTFDITPFISLCSLDIICETAMGTKIDAQLDSHSAYVSAVYDSCGLAFRRMVSPWLYSDIIYNMTKSGQEWSTNLTILHGFTKKVIAGRKEELKDQNSIIKEVEKEDGVKHRLTFLDLLINVSESGSVLTDEDIQNEVDTFMFEGHDTTAASISVTLYLLALNKDCQRKCQDELDSIFGDSSRRPTSGDLSSMRYLTACIKESLRLYGSIPSIARVTSDDLEVEGHLIPAKTEICLLFAILHRDPTYFPDPERFDPERFLLEGKSKRHPYAYVPFSAGPRNCIGQKFAMMEEKVIISSILRRFTMTATIDMKDMLIVPEIVIKPKDGYYIHLEIRK